MATKIFWAKTEFIGISLLPVGFLVFGLQFTGRGHWLTPSRLALLSAPAFLTILLAFTNEFHHQIWSSIVFAHGAPFGPLELEHGLSFFISSAYIYALIVVTGGLLFQIAISGESLYAAQARIMLIGIAIPLLANFIYISRANPFPEIDYSPIAITITNGFIAIGFFRYRFMDLLPVAHNLVFNAMNDGVVVVDRKNRIADINPTAKQLFPKRKDFIGINLLELFPEWDSWKTSNQDGNDINKEWVCETPSGSRTFRIHSARMEESQQTQGGEILILNDITDQERARREAIEANQMKTQLLANVSHDLRTPLGAIIGYAEMLKSDMFGALNPDQENATSEILDSADQLLSFVNNLIGQAQIETGRMLLRERPFDVDELIGPLLSTLRFHASKKGLTLEYDVDTALPKEIIGDSYWLRQIVLNLVHNAVKFTEQGSVSLKFQRHSENQWAIQVKDTGIGIPVEAHTMIFEAFKQVDGTSTRKQPGSGLGLSIVRQLTTLMRGTIELQSSPGAGSTFTVILPLIPSPEESRS
jgi:signal transduction histidine kinase